ncbi:MAG: AbrB/MazE/SpoVT family DNA-binding domain-containing protein [Candidatus Jordarchaeaceae archaeon]
MSEDMVVVGKKHVVMIPERIREIVGLKEGDVLKVRVEGKNIVLEPISPDPFKVLENIIGTPYSEEEDEKRAEEWLEDASRRH